MPTMKFTTAKDKNKKISSPNNKYDGTDSPKNKCNDSTIKAGNGISSNFTTPKEITSKKCMKCPLCTFSCLFSSQMIQHTLKHHTGQLPKGALIAKKDVSATTKRKIELKYVNGGKKAKLENVDSLPLGPITSDAKSTSVTHSITTCTASPPTVYACKECEYHNTIKKNYERHMWCHTSDFPFKCKHCSFSSNAENAVQRHITQYHTAIKKNLLNSLKEQQTLQSSQAPVSNIKVEREDDNSRAKTSNGSNTRKATLDRVFKKETPEKLLKCIIIKTRTKENLTSWTCHSCKFTSFSSATMDEHTTTVHHTPLHNCVTIIQDYYIINGADPKEVREGVACAHCGFEAANMEVMRSHLKKDCHGVEKGKADDSGEEGVHEGLSLALDKADSKGKGTLSKFSKALNQMMEQFNSFYGTSSKKLHMVCFLCKYKTFSMKVLKKHLVKEHADIITNRKELTSLARKCLFFSLKQECKLINKTLLLRSKQQRTSLTHEPADAAVSENEDVSGEEGLLKTEADGVSMQQSLTNDDKDPNSPESYKKKILESFQQEGELTKVFECSVCGKKVFFKCNLKKHVESIHPKAKITQLSLADGTLTQEDLCKFHKKHRVNKLKKLLSKRGLSKNKLIALNSLITDELGGQKVDYVLDRSEGTGDEKVGMIDNLRLKRFQCGVCSFRSNFRSDISRHLKVKHPNHTNSFYTVLSIQEATESFESYKQARPSIDMRYTKQRSLTLLSNKSPLPTENHSTVASEAIKFEATPTFTHFSSASAASSCEVRAFYMSLPYSIRRSNPLEDFLKCDICPFYTFKATSFKVHRSCHQTINRSNMLSCPHCPFFVSTKRLYEKHLQQHSHFNLVLATRASNAAARPSAFTGFYGYHSSVYNSNYISDYLHFCHQNYKTAHLRFCQHKYVCPHCPFRTNRREDFWSHGKFHLVGKDKSSDFKCDQCCFYATDRRGLMQHSTLHNKGYTPKAKLSQSDLVKGEFCRCDLADFLKYPDLACFKQLSCTYCSYCNNSVRLLRQHIASHVPLTNCYNTRIFCSDLDNADDVLNILCTRLLNMNYCLAEESHKDAEKADENNNEMPVLEKFTDLPSPGLYNPYHSISVLSEKSLSKPPIKVINLYNNSIKHLSDHKPPKIIKITSHLTSKPPTPTCLPKLASPSCPSIHSLSMPLLKASTFSQEVQAEVKEDFVESSAVESLESLMQSVWLSAPEEEVAEAADHCEAEEGKKEKEEEEEERKKEEKEEGVNMEKFSQSTQKEVTGMRECPCAKKIYMLSLGLVEVVNL